MKRKVLLLTILLVTVSSVAGCRLINRGQNIETKYYSINIDGEKDYIEEKNEEVLKISKFAEEFVYSFSNVDYKVQESYSKEIDFYTSTVKAQKEEYDYNKMNEEYMNKYELVREVSDYEVEEIEFYKKNRIETAEITFTYKNNIKNCTEEYLERTKRKLNTPYKLRYKVKVEKEDNNWLVSEILDKEYVE